MPVAIVLDLCDRLLGEIGRRQHRFSWLRAPGAGIEDCLICDAYYPGNRLVVMCRADGSEPDALYAEEVPRHGLLLLLVTPAALGPDRLSASEALVAQIGALGPLPDRPHGPAENDRRPAGDGALARVGASFARAGAPAPTKPRRREPARAPASSAPPALPAPPGRATRGTARRAPPPSLHAGDHAEGFGMLIGIALMIALGAESLILVVLVALGNGHPLLAFGFAFDAGARALGTIAAAREGDRGYAWSCLLIGSPAVLQYVLLRPDGPVEAEPGPLAGVVSVLAISIIVIALLGALIGI